VAPSPPPSPPASSPSAVASTTDALIAQEWLQTSANQLTYHGLEKLHCGCHHLQPRACNHVHATTSTRARILLHPSSPSPTPSSSPTPERL
jgi:hypothetical protein